MSRLTKDRVYVVEVLGQPSRLVRATHPLNAIRHVTERLLTVRHATQDDLLDLLQAGVVCENAGNDPEPQQAGNGSGDPLLGFTT